MQHHGGSIDNGIHLTAQPGVFLGCHPVSHFAQGIHPWRDGLEGRTCGKCFPFSQQVAFEFVKLADLWYEFTVTGMFFS